MRGVKRRWMVVVVGLLAAACSSGSSHQGASASDAGAGTGSGGSGGIAGGTGGSGTGGSGGTAGDAGHGGTSGVAGTAGGAGRGGTGGPADGGAGGQAGADGGAGITCGTIQCAAGQVCLTAHGGQDPTSPGVTSCIDNPCAPMPLACSCAASSISECYYCSSWNESITCYRAVCAAPDTPIATPSGDQPLATLRAGDLVYSLDRGQLAAVPIAATSRTRVEQHRVVRVVLDSGRVLMISPGHPTAGGETFADLRAGSALGERRVASAALVPYPYAFTHDILPASDTGTYLAAGALIGSTLRAPAETSTER